MTRSDHPRRQQQSSQQRTMALAEMRRNRTPTIRLVDDGSSDAPRHRKEHSGVWLFTWYRSTWYRKHLATKHLETKQTASCPHDALASYRLFPNSEIRWPRSPSVSLKAIVGPPPQSQFYDPRMLPAPHTAEEQGCLRAHCDSDRFSTARERGFTKRRLGAPRSAFANPSARA